jgi:hypothetical protein
MKFVDPVTLEPDAYMRLPKPGRKFCGMCRTSLQNLADDGFIDIVSVQRPGCSRGLKLLFVPSLMDYLDGLRRNPRSPLSHTDRRAQGPINPKEIYKSSTRPPT